MTLLVSFCVSFRFALGLSVYKNRNTYSQRNILLFKNTFGISHMQMNICSFGFLMTTNRLVRTKILTAIVMTVMIMIIMMTKIAIRSVLLETTTVEVMLPVTNLVSNTAVQDRILHSHKMRWKSMQRNSNNILKLWI